MGQGNKVLNLDTSGHTVYMTEKLRENLKANIENITGNPLDSYKSFSDFFTDVIERAMGNPAKKHFQEDLQEIERLQKLLQTQTEVTEKQAKELNELVQQNNKLTLSIKSDKTKEEILTKQTARLNHYKEYSKQLQNEKEQLLVVITNLQKEVEQLLLEKENLQVVKVQKSATLPINLFQAEILKHYINSPAINESFIKINKNGKYNGLVDVLYGTENEMVVTLLKNVFFGSLLGLQVKQLYSPKVIKESFERFKKSENE